MPLQRVLRDLRDSGGSGPVNRILGRMLHTGTGIALGRVPSGFDGAENCGRKRMGKKDAKKSSSIKASGRAKEMMHETEPAHVHMVPFGTIRISCVIAGPPPEAPEDQETEQSVKILRGTSALAEIVSSSIFEAEK